MNIKVGEKTKTDIINELVKLDYRYKPILGKLYAKPRDELLKILNAIKKKKRVLRRTKMEDKNLITCYFTNDDDRMRDVENYADDYEFEASLINSYYDEDCGKVDVWKLTGPEENIDAFIEDYCLELVVEKISKEC